MRRDVIRSETAQRWTHSAQAILALRSSETVTMTDSAVWAEKRDPRLWQPHGSDAMKLGCAVDPRSLGPSRGALQRHRASKSSPWLWRRRGAPLLRAWLCLESWVSAKSHIGRRRRKPVKNKKE